MIEYIKKHKYLVTFFHNLGIFLFPLFIIHTTMVFYASKDIPFSLFFGFILSLPYSFGFAFMINS